MHKPCLAASRQSTDEKICIFIEHFCVWRLFLCFSSHLFPSYEILDIQFPVRTWKSFLLEVVNDFEMHADMPRERRGLVYERITNEKFFSGENRSQLQASSLKIYMQCEKQKELTLNFLSQQFFVSVTSKILCNREEI